MLERRLLTACVASALSAILLSVFLHSSSTVNLYSDIASFWGRSWLSGGQLPYSSSNAFLEYPPVSGIILYASRVLGGAIAGIYRDLYSGYYYSFSLISLAASAVLGWSTWRLARAVGRGLNPLYFLLPSMVIYGIYNFDLFNALFIVLCLQFFAEKRRGWSAVTLGVALATKFVAGVLLPIFLMELVGWKERWRYLGTAVSVAGAFFVPIAIFNPGYFSQFISFYSGWGLEDAWYIWIFGDPFSSTAKVFGLVVMILLLARIYTLKMPLIPRSFLALSAYLLGTYIYAPQFNVMLIPLLAVLAVSTPALFFFDVFNVLIILTWFSVPATPTSGPTYPWTVPQAMALLRSICLALLGLSVASGTGHSLTDWIRSRTGLGGPVQTRLPTTKPGEK